VAVALPEEAPILDENGVKIDCCGNGIGANLDDEEVVVGGGGTMPAAIGSGVSSRVCS